MTAKDNALAQSCRYDIEHGASETALVLRCRGCKKESSLSDPDCMHKVISLLGENSGIDRVVLSNFTEKQYGQASVSVLSSILSISNELGYLSLREPPEEAGGARGAKQCAKCAFHPKVMHGALKSALASGINAMRMEAERISGELGASGTQNGAANRPHAQSGQACAKCAQSAREDISHIYSMLSRFESEVAYKAFSVIEKSEGQLSGGR